MMVSEGSGSILAAYAKGTPSRRYLKGNTMNILIIGNKEEYANSKRQYPVTHEVTIVSSMKELHELLRKHGHGVVDSVSDATDLLSRHYDCIEQDFMNFLDNRV